MAREVQGPNRRCKFIQFFKRSLPYSPNCLTRSTNLCERNRWHLSSTNVFWLNWTSTHIPVRMGSSSAIVTRIGRHALSYMQYTYIYFFIRICESQLGQNHCGLIWTRTLKTIWTPFIWLAPSIIFTFKKSSKISFSNPTLFCWTSISSYLRSTFGPIFTIASMLAFSQGNICRTLCWTLSYIPVHWKWAPPWSKKQW